MNKAYKSIYNESTGTFVAVAENVQSRGKRSSSARRLRLVAAVVSSLAITGLPLSTSAQADGISVEGNTGAASIIEIGETLKILGNNTTLGDYSAANIRTSIDGDTLTIAF
ncbi:MAG TPA: ESPR domain-containing protein, partial [Burkholderiaceae bacterium]|nr:ESPR domain-containing protein [Burkholderiaceae bacterium]